MSGAAGLASAAGLRGPVRGLDPPGSGISEMNCYSLTYGGATPSANQRA